MAPSSASQGVEQGSRCQQCDGGGELVLCDGCPKAYHPICLLSDQLPSNDAGVPWHCPACYQKIHTEEANIKRAGQGFIMQIAAKSVQKGHTTRDNALLWVDEKEKMMSGIASTGPSMQDRRVTRRDMMVQRMDSHVASSSRGREERGSGNDEARGDEKGASSPNSMRGRGGSTNWGAGHAHISVGSTFQIHGLFSHFLEAGMVDCEYDSYQKQLMGDRIPRLDPRSLRIGNDQSSRKVSIKDLRKPKQDPRLRSCVRQCQLVWSPHIMRSLVHGKSYTPGYITTPQGIDYFIEQVRRDWPKRLLYPFQEEFALQLLYDCRFNAQLAYQILQSPDFDFNARCHPATAPYMNKWHPRHTRGQFLSLPFQWKLGNKHRVGEKTAPPQNSMQADLGPKKEP